MTGVCHGFFGSKVLSGCDWLSANKFMAFFKEINISAEGAPFNTNFQEYYSINFNSCSLFILQNSVIL